MESFREWLHRLWGSIAPAPRHRDGDLEEELKTHLALAEEDARRRGASAENAARDTRLTSGGISQAMDALHDQRGLPWLDDLISDLHHSGRSLVRSPGFTAVALTTLALGIGANTAIFSIVNTVILQSLGHPQPERLMHLMTQAPAMGSDRLNVSAPEYLQFRAINQSFSAIGAYTTAEVNLVADDQALRVRSAGVDEHLLEALRVQPLQGRLFARGETDAIGFQEPARPTPQPPPIVILSHELWQSGFGGRNVVGEFVEVHGRPREIIGVMPPGFDVMDSRTEIWLPLGLSHADRRSDQHFLKLIGRLKDGVTAQMAQAELNSLTDTWMTRVGPSRHAFVPPGRENAHFLDMMPLQDEVVGSAGRAIWILQAAVGLILLIACVNLANLLLARAELRHREFAVRAALGAGRARLLRQFAAEGLLLAIAGGTLGLGLAWIGLQTLTHAFPNALPRTSSVSIDGPVLLFTFAVATGTGLMFGLAPMMITHLNGLSTALKEGGLRGSTVARHLVRRTLVATEVALAVILVVAAALLLRTVYNLTMIDTGFDRSRLVTFAMTLPNFRYPDPANRSQFYQTLLETLRAVPGVQTVAAMSGLPLSRPPNMRGLELAQTSPVAHPPEFGYNADFQAVMANYFETMRIPIVQGRGVQAGDAGSPGLVAVVNETLADTFWPGQDPIGRRLRPCCGDRTPWFTVIGVAKDAKQQGVDQPTTSEFYFLVEQTGRLQAYWMFGTGAPGTMNIVLRTTLPPAVLSQTIQRVVRNVDPAIPIVRLRSMEEVFVESIRRPRLLAHLLGLFACLALSLAVVGIYGLLSYMVAERRREMGIRIALGARRSMVLAQVMRQGLLLTGIGIGVGLAGALGLNRVIASLLFGVTPTDGGTLVAVIAVILLAAAIGCGLPAWRASRVDPNVMLRSE